MARKKLRPLSEITQDLEPLYFEMVHDHGLQAHEVMALFLGWAKLHYDHCIEEFDDESLKPSLVGTEYRAAKKKS